MKPIIQLLIMALIVGSIGKYTSDRVMDDLRLRRRRSEAQTSEMVVYANLMNGKLGLVIG
jgi:uncharacterized membrane protein (DUF106 family)